MDKSAGDGIPTFKLLLVGDRRTGKSTFLERHKSGEYESRYIATQDIDVVSLNFNTNRGPIRYFVWDTAGDQQFGGLGEAYYIQAACAILFHDLSSENTVQNIPIWHRDLIRITGHIPIVLCGNKSDKKKQKVKPNLINLNMKNKVPYFQISVKTKHNFEMPILWLTRTLVGDPLLEFVAAPAPLPLVQPVKPEDQQKVEDDMNEASTILLDDDGDF